MMTPKKLWFYVRRWALRKVYASLSKDYEEQYHEYLMDATLRFLDREHERKQKSSNAVGEVQYSDFELDPNYQNHLFAGYIAADWEARINKKIEEKNKKDTEGWE
jgi:hypothetical protein